MRASARVRQREHATCSPLQVDTRVRVILLIITVHRALRQEVPIAVARARRVAARIARGGPPPVRGEDRHVVRLCHVEARLRCARLVAPAKEELDHERRHDERGERSGRAAS